MKSRVFNETIVSMMVITFVISSTLLQRHQARGKVFAEGNNREELLIKDLYLKLSLHNAASNKDDADGNRRKYDSTDDVKFNVGKVHTGPITEILEKRLYDLTSFPSGNIVRIAQNTIKYKGESEEYVGYNAYWDVGQYTTVTTPRDASMKDVMASLGSKYADVGRFSTYEVTVRLGKISRTYKAMVLYHTPNSSISNPKPEFWDWITGIGGILDEFWVESRPLIGSKKIGSLIDESNSINKYDKEISPQGHYLSKSSGTVFDCDKNQPICCPQSASSISQCCWNSRYAYSNPGIVPACASSDPTSKSGQSIAIPHRALNTEIGNVASAVTTCLEETRYGSLQRWNESDSSDHLLGRHTFSTALQGVCQLTSDCNETCRVLTQDTPVHSESRFSIFITSNFHYGKLVSAEDRGTGYVGDSIICKKSSGVGTMGCLFTPSCGGSVSIGLPTGGVGSFSVTVSGGELWNKGWGLTHTCKFPSGYNVTNNTQCGPGTGSYCFYSSNGSTCSQGTVAFPPCCCFWSPIVIDISRYWDWTTNSGTGYQFTDAAGGVRFDLTGNGSMNQVAWPTATSENAWLALDRNGNGVIDSGKELFGNFTDQVGPNGETVPPGQGNGWQALAEFDRGRSGGNDNGIIDTEDAVFSNLRLWVDRNHNGISEPNELLTLQSIGLTRIELFYGDVPWTDQYGNRFKFRARFIWGSLDQEPYVEWYKDAWDVYPQWTP